MAERTLKCVMYNAAEDRYEYLRNQNPLLAHPQTPDGRTGVYAVTKMFGREIKNWQDADQFASKAFADLLASQLTNGRVIEQGYIIGDIPSVFNEPMRLIMWGPSSSPKLFVAGPVAREMAYDWHNWNQRSGDIAALMGVEYHAGLFEGIFDACLAAGLLA